MSLPVRGAWIEIQRVISVDKKLLSLPVRGAWIEINEYHICPEMVMVAPCEGSVD